MGQLLRILHEMGLVSGILALAMFALAPVAGVYKRRNVFAPMALLLLMICLTLYSQFSIIPAMEQDRVAAGGVIEAADVANPSRIDFEKLHHRAEHVEETILLLGLVTVALGAGAGTALETVLKRAFNRR